MCSQRWQTAFERNDPEELHHRGADERIRKFSASSAPLGAFEGTRRHSVNLRGSSFGLWQRGDLGQKSAYHFHVALETIAPDAMPRFGNVGDTEPRHQRL